MVTGNSEQEMENLLRKVEKINRSTVHLLSAVLQTYSALSAVVREVGATEKILDELDKLESKIEKALEVINEATDG